MAKTTTNERKAITTTRKSDKRRAEIMRAAIEAINARSYAQATMVSIAAALDLRDATLYHYFHDKRTLAYACHRSSLGRAQQLLEAADQAGGPGKLHRFIRSMLVDSKENGALLYLGDYSYLAAAQRKSVHQWVDRLKTVLKRFLEEGMADGSIVPCEPELIVELLMGMLIWLGKWVPDVQGLTIDRLMGAIDIFGFAGLDSPSSRARVARATGKKIKRVR